MPSATANSGSATSSWSWLLARTRPTSVAAPGPQLDHRLHFQGRLADLEPVTLAHGDRRVVTLLPVEVGAVGGAEVLDEELAVAAEHPGVELGDEGVVGERRRRSRRPARRSARRRAGTPDPARSGGLDDDQPLARPGRRPAAATRAGPAGAGAARRRRPAGRRLGLAQLDPHRPQDPEEEEVQEGQEDVL